MSSRALVVTTINQPNEALRVLGAGAEARQIPFFILGDTKSPDDFSLPGGQFVSLAQQHARFPAFARALPSSHYVRKNVGYLLAFESGAEEIQETDDDNIPRDEFWDSTPDSTVEVVRTDRGWFNVYALFSEETIWPRGFPLQYLQTSRSVGLEKEGAPSGYVRQGLADENPDVDAVYRLTRKLPITFQRRGPVILPAGIWSPFNSQNTLFQRAAFPLLYLPSKCSFRMTDIWRSFVAQRCLWEMDGGVLFHSATVWQERNEHSLLRDFEDEIPGYLLNDKIRNALEKLSLDRHDTLRNQHLCYEALASEKLIPKEELPILREWEQMCEKLQIS